MSPPETAPVPASPRTGTPVLRMKGISKEFYGVRVLNDVDLECEAGEVHAIVGENGAGKSTLMKILVGAYAPTEGEVLIDGEPVHFSHPLQGQRAGVSIIYQEFNLLPDRTVAENIYLGREPRRGILVDRGKMEEDAAAILGQLSPDDPISPREMVGTLPVSKQQTVEIAKALSLDSKIVVMDEPTAALSAHEVERLFAQIRRLKERGIAVLYISHRLKEIFEIAERITVLKDGERVATKRTSEVNTAELVRMMVGRELSQYFPPRAAPEAVGEPKLRLRGAGNDFLANIDLDVRAGEILGVAGLQGSGRTELARAIFGADPFTSGRLELDGKERQIRSPGQAVAAGIGFVTEDRKEEGLALSQSVRDNVALAWRGLKRATRREHTLAVEDLVKAVELRFRNLGQEVRFLSGGNQQKVVLAKWLATEPRLLIFDEPTRGIDVGAKAGIHDLIRGLANEGVAVILISSELPEVIGMSDRIIVMRQGEIAGEVEAGASEAEIMFLATGERDIAADEPAGPQTEGTP
ncbi:MAG TPA: sugar ABC transporter ATP-binding protein [Solirubrobacterales bacterium]|nr:sugar ABC transporter ATP-binding protein [Solirubrobacterales bacterium]